MRALTHFFQLLIDKKNSLSLDELRRVEQKLDHLTALFAILSQINQAIVRTQDRQELFRQICSIIVDTGKLRMAWIGLIDRESKIVKPVTYSGVEEGYLAKIRISIGDDPEGRGPTGSAIRNRAYSVCNDISADPQMEPFQEKAVRRGYRSSAAFPLEVNNSVIGALTLYSAEPGFFDQDEIDLLDEISKDISFALENMDREARRKDAEAALIREKNRSEAIIAAMGDGISIQDRDFRILYQNERHREMSRGNHVGKYCYQAYENRDRVCEECPILESYKDGKVHSVERAANFDGKTHYFEIMSSPLRNAEGTVAAGIEAVREITGRKQMEQCLQESENRYKLLVESITDYIYTVKVENGSPVRTVHGPGCLSVTGYTAEEFDADRNLWYNIIHGEDRAAVVDHANRILSGEAVTAFEHRIYHKNGSVQWIRNTPVPRFSGDGRLIDYDGLISNITPLKQLEAQLRQAQKMEAVGQLAGGIAHDFNNILTAIIGYANLLKMKLPGQPALRSYSEQILASADRAAHLTHSLLAFSRKQIIDLKPVDLNTVIRRVENLLIRLIGEDVELKTKLLATELQVLADSVQIEQILMNLATNARDAMPDGGLITIETSLFEMGEEFMRTYGYGKPGTYAACTFSDTGVGMDEKTRLKIFDPFFTTKEVGKGTGLGLAMVYGIVKQHNGYINVVSEPSRGTTFTVLLPVTENREIQENAELPAIMRKGNETILLAEDDPEVRNLVTAVLEDSGYAIIPAVDGEEAVRKFMENRDRIDMLILDIIMPKKNGKEAYQEIKQMNPGIKALFTSGYTAQVIHQKGILETGLDFILKPISPAHLLDKVRTVLDKA